MKARGDIQIPEAWTQDKKAALKKASDEAFGKYDAVQVQIGSLRNTLNTKIANIHLLSEEAQSYTNQAQDPRIFVLRLLELNKEMGDLSLFISRKVESGERNIVTRKEMFDKRPTPKDPAMLKQMTQMRDAEVKAQGELETRIQRFVQMVKRATLIPQELRAHKEIAPELKQFSDTANRVKVDIGKVKGFQTTIINDMNGYIKALTP